MLSLVSSTWMLKVHGEGELGINNQGRFRFLSFSQETDRANIACNVQDSGQHKPKIGNVRPEVGELSAGCTTSSNSTPHLFFRAATVSLLCVALGPAASASVDAAASAPAVRPPVTAPSNVNSVTAGVRKPVNSAASNIRRPSQTALRKQPPSKDEIRQKIREAAVMYEKHFLREMWKSMRATAPGGQGMVPSGPGQKLYQEQLDDQYIDQWSAQGGVGYSDIIYKQLIEKYGAQMGL